MPPINPYTAGPPLWNAQDFFGRQDTQKWVIRELHKPAINALLLFGQRRIGKTSFLLQLLHTLPNDAFLPVYFNLQHQVHRPLGQLLADLALRVTKAANLEPVSEALFDHEGRFFHQTFLSQLEKVLGTKRLVFLFDEFDMLDQVTEGQAPTIASKALLPFLDRYMADNPWPAFVFIMGKGVEKLPLNFTAFVKQSLTKRTLGTGPKKWRRSDTPS